MKRIAGFFLSLMLVGLFVTPFSASATGFSFGGRVTFLLPCLSFQGPSVWTVIIPAGSTPQTTYIWTPATLMGTTPDPMPYAVGQHILGLADIPYFCCLPPAYPTPGGCYTGTLAWIILPGQRMQFAGQSPLPVPAP